MSPRKRVLVIGSINVDLVTRVPRCPKPGESLQGSHFAILPGGKGANQAVACARLGAEACFIGAVGDDPFGTHLRQALEGSQVDASGLQVAKDQSTGTAVIFVADDGTNLIAVTPSANTYTSAAIVEGLRDRIREADAVLVQLEINPEATLCALRIAREEGTLSVLDAGPAQPLSSEFLEAADIVSPNETEAQAITGITVSSLESAEAAGRALCALGAKDVVLKLGAHGAMHVAETATHVPAFDVIPVDTVAAGDAFTAALALTWADGDVADALRFANAAGALAATRVGAQDAMPTREEVDRLNQEGSSRV